MYRCRWSWFLVLLLPLCACTTVGRTPVTKHHAHVEQNVQTIDELLKQGLSARSRGQINEALRYITKASTLAQESKDSDRLALSLALSSDVYLANRQLEKAEQQAGQAFELAKRNAKPIVMATVFNSLGNVGYSQRNFVQAIDYFQQGINIAKNQDPLLIVKLNANLLDALWASGRTESIDPVYEDTLKLLMQLPASTEKNALMIKLGSFFLRDPSGLASHALQSIRLLVAAEQFSRKTQAMKFLSYALGYRAEVYAGLGQPDEALYFFHQALFYAQQTNSPELLSRWYWRRGYVFKTLGELDRAEKDYHLAIEQFSHISSALIFGRRGDPLFYRDTVGRVYRELVEILLAKYENNKQASVNLKDVLAVMERYKTVELKTYFLDDCVSQWQQNFRTATIDQMATEGSAILYPVIFPQRTVMLYSIGHQAWEYQVIDVAEDDIARAINNFRHQLVPGGNSRKLKKYGLQLYRWFIEPMERQLQGQNIDTLVIVPDGLLRTIPFAALHDGRDFLIKRFAFAISPGLELTYFKDTAQVEKTFDSLFIGGISKSISGFPALHFVPQEINQIAMMNQSKPLLNEKFSRENIQTELQSHVYSIIHFATHTRIENDPKKSFLLTYDERITFPELHRFVQGQHLRDVPIDLLVLSACDTAMGDERAALGLAGVAIKAGASSVVASLWPVSDQSTALLMPSFFAKLKQRQYSRTKALQLAQLSLLESDRYFSPFFWAAFVLIGDWR